MCRKKCTPATCGAVTNSRPEGFSPAVSIVMPLYNCAAYLPQALQSLADQTCQDFELILVDDGSGDDTLAIARRFAASRPMTYVLEQQHRFAGAARNLGMQQAVGEYLLFLDGDDIFDCTLVKKAVGRMRSTGADVCVWRALNLDDKTGKVEVANNTCDARFYPASLEFNRESNPDCIFCFTSPSPWTKLFRTDFIRRQGLEFQATRSANDVLFVELALALAGKIAILDDNLIVYRRNTGASLQATQRRAPLAFYEAIVALRDGLRERGILAEVNTAFLNLAAEMSAYNLYTLRHTPDAQEAVFDMLRNEGLAELGLADAPDSLFFFTPILYRRSFLRLRRAKTYRQFRRGEARDDLLRTLRHRLP